MPLEDYEIRHVEEHERPSILDHIMEHFFTNEYILATYLEKIRPSISDQEWQDIKDSFRQAHSGMAMNEPCFFAIHRPTQEVVGYLLPILEKNPKFSSSDVEDANNHVKVDVSLKSKIMSNWFASVLDVMCRSVDFFELYPEIETTLDMGMLCVFPNHSGRGLATAMTQFVVDWSKNQKIGLVHGCFTSQYSRRAAEKVGFRSYKDIDIMSFRDPEGNVVYAGTKPHVITVMAYLC